VIAGVLEEADREIVGLEVYLFTCPRCGNFVGAHGNIGWLKIETPEHQVRLSGWVREQNAATGKSPVISQETSRRVAGMSLPGLRERANRTLLVIARKWPELDGWYIASGLASDLELQGITYSRDEAEASVLLRLLVDQSQLSADGGAGSISTRGLLDAEALATTRPNSLHAFVAMSFDESLRDAWTNGFDPAIRAAGYIPVRIDNKEYVGGISDEIIAEIRLSRFVVADYTKQVNGVYFEAGFVLGLGLIVIPTCRADELDKLHFDIRHINTLSWKEPGNLVDALSKRIRAVIGAGPNFQN
jgi:hypothetical protein